MSCFEAASGQQEQRCERRKSATAAFGSEELHHLPPRGVCAFSSRQKRDESCRELNFGSARFNAIGKTDRWWRAWTKRFIIESDDAGARSPFNANMQKTARARAQPRNSKGRE